MNWRNSTLYLIRFRYFWQLIHHLKLLNFLRLWIRRIKWFISRFRIDSKWLFLYLIKNSICPIFEVQLSPVLELLPKKSRKESIKDILNKIMSFLTEVRVKMRVVNFDTIREEMNRDIFHSLIINRSPFLLSHSLH